MIAVDDLLSLLNLAKTASIQASAAQPVAELIARAEAALNEMAFSQENARRSLEAARRATPEKPPVDPITT